MENKKDQNVPYTDKPEGQDIECVIAYTHHNHVHHFLYQWQCPDCQKLCHYASTGINVTEVPFTLEEYIRGPPHMVMECDGCHKANTVNPILAFEIKEILKFAHTIVQIPGQRAVLRRSPANLG